MLCPFYIRIGTNYAYPAPVELYRKPAGDQEYEYVSLNVKD